MELRIFCSLNEVFLEEVFHNIPLYSSNDLSYATLFIFWIKNILKFINFKGKYW